MELIDRRALPWEQQELDQDGSWTLKAEYIEAAPTIDAVPVVRCKDCSYWKTAKVNAKGFLICPASGMEITEDDYCSYGERKEDNA